MNLPRYDGDNNMMIIIVEAYEKILIICNFLNRSPRGLHFKLGKVAVIIIF